MHTHSRAAVGPEREAVIDPGPSRTSGGPPPVVAGDVSFIDVAQRSLHTEEPEGRSERPVVGDGDAVLARVEPERDPEGRKPLVDGIAEELSDDIS